MSNPTRTKDLQQVMETVIAQYDASPLDKERIHKAVTSAAVAPVVQVTGAGISTVSLLKGVGIVVLAALLSAVAYQQLSRRLGEGDVSTDHFETGQPPGAYSPEFFIKAPTVSIPAIAEDDDANMNASGHAAVSEGAPSPRESRRKDSAVKPDTFAAELRLISQATIALNRGNNNDALAVLAQHRQEFPSGLMTQERIGLEVLALCKSGQTQKAEKKYKKFKRRSPKAPVLMRIQTTCGF